MTSRERILTALKRGKPDMVPATIMGADRVTVDALKKKGIFTVNHNCGRMMDVFELMVSTGVDVIESLTPSSHGGIAMPLLRMFLPMPEPQECPVCIIEKFVKETIWEI